jgi:hypothetical protein
MMDLAQAGTEISKKLIVCNGPDCNFEDLIRLVTGVMDVLIMISFVAATIAFIWIGFTLLTSQGDSGAMKKAKDVGMKVVLGLVFVLAGWLIVYTISSVLLNKGFTLLESIRR